MKLRVKEIEDITDDCWVEPTDRSTRKSLKVDAFDIEIVLQNFEKALGVDRHKIEFLDGLLNRLKGIRWALIDGQTITGIKDEFQKVAPNNGSYRVYDTHTSPWTFIKVSYKTGNYNRV